MNIAVNQVSNASLFKRYAELLKRAQSAYDNR